MKRLAWVDTGRGIAIVLVALFHSTNWLLAVGFDLDTSIKINVVLSSVRMPLFFAISGLFAAKWLDGTWHDLVRHKVLLFVWVYLVWEVVGATVAYFGMGLNGDRTSVAHAVRDLLLSPVAPRFELWFIWALAIFFVVAKLTRSVPARVQLIVAGLVSIAALSAWDAPNVGWGGSLKYYAFFLAGIYLRDLIFAFSRVQAPVVLTGIVLLWAGYGTALVFLDLQGVPGLYFLNCVLGLMAGVSLGRALARVSILPYLGSRTLPIYLGHTPIIVTIALGLSAVDVVGIVPRPLSYALPALLAVMAVTLALLVNRGAVNTSLRWLYAPPAWVERLVPRSAVSRRATPASSGGRRAREPSPSGSHRRKIE